MAAPDLIGGPYTAPAVRAGDWLDDEIDGRLEVGGWTSAPLSWPRRKKTGRASLILTADLARAVRVESVEAICHWWGVRPTKVWMWRKALGVDRVTEGTRLLLQERTGVPPEAAERGRAAASTPEARAKISASKRGKPVPEQTRAALLRAAKRKKPPGWGVRANARMLGRDLPSPDPGSLYSLEELEAIRKHYPARPAADVAALLGRPFASVVNMARRLRVDGWERVRWTAEQDALLVANYVDKGVKWCSEQIGRTRAAVVNRAKVLKIPGRGAGPNPKGSAKGGWSEHELLVLRRDYESRPTSELAQTIGRTRKAVIKMADNLGLQQPHAPDWTEEQDNVLRQSYQEHGASWCGHKTGRTVVAVRARALYLGLTRKRVRPLK